MTRLARVHQMSNRKLILGQARCPPHRHPVAQAYSDASPCITQESAATRFAVRFEQPIQPVESPRELRSTAKLASCIQCYTSTPYFPTSDAARFYFRCSFNHATEGSVWSRLRRKAPVSMYQTSSSSATSPLHRLPRRQDYDRFFFPFKRKKWTR